MKRMRLWARRAAIVIAGAVVIGAGERDARACGAEEYAVEIVIPPEDGSAMPREGALVAGVLARADAPAVVLRSITGVEIAVQVQYEIDASGETAVLIARPVAPLDPNVEYVWEVDGQWQRAFVAGDAMDLVAPMPGDIEIASAWEHEISNHCAGGILVVDNEIEVVGVSEPIAVIARQRLEGAVSRLAVAYGTRVLLRNDTTGERCFEIDVVDHAGHVVSAGEHCIAEPDGEPEPPGTEDEPIDDGASQDEAGLGSRGCACASVPAEDRSGGSLFAMPLLIAVLRRRRS